MVKVENLISKVEAEARVALESGIIPPDPIQERPVLKRLKRKYPELNINVEEDVKILTHARLLLNATNN